MYKRLFRYSDFLSEGKSEMLLEAKIKYAPLFSKLLGNIDSPVAKALLGLSEKEVDVNTNFIEVNKDKGDVVYFKPDDKAAKAAVANNPAASLGVWGGKFLGDLYRVPKAGQSGVIERVISEEEVGHELPSGVVFVVFMWRDEQGEGRCVFDRRRLLLGEEAVKKSEVGVGKLAKSMLKKSGAEFSDSDIEDFVYKYRAQVANLGDAFSRFRIVEGEDIRKYYHYDIYESDKGTLGSSCMRYDRCQAYLDIYVNNPEQCRLLVLMSELKDNHICGRALIWTDSEGRQLMDRIYTTKTQDEQLFKDFAKKSGFYCKGGELVFVSPDGEEKKISSRIYLDKSKFEYYPYMDTFKYLSSGSNAFITNDWKTTHDYELTDTDGGNGQPCEMCSGEGVLECPECYGRGDFRCRECDGEGVLECGSCGGMHKMECTQCDGSGKNEEDGECSHCSGTGMHTCEECLGVNTECPECVGSGRVECDFCNGDRSVPCPECG